MIMIILIVILNRSNTTTNNNDNSIVIIVMIIGNALWDVAPLRLARADREPAGSPHRGQGENWFVFFIFKNY